MSRHEIYIPEAVLSYPHLFEARSVQGGNPRYGANFVLDPTNPGHAQCLQQINQARSQVLAESFQGQQPGRDLPLVRGEDQKNPMPGKIILRAASGSRPQVADENVNPVIDPEKFYPGCIVNGLVNVYVFNNQTGRGITFGLEAVQFVRDGDRLDERPDIRNVFQPVPGGGLPGGGGAPPAGGGFDWMS